MKKVEGLGMAVGVFIVLAASGCSDDGDAPQPGRDSGIRVALSVGPPRHDVAAVVYQVYEGQTACEGVPIATATAGIEDEPLPPLPPPQSFGPNHMFADAFFVLPPGDYTVCAIPVTGYGTPSAVCDVAQRFVTVDPRNTTEIVLVSQCQDTPNGGLDAVTVFNDPPQITALHFTPGKFVKSCEPFTITASAVDPNGDGVEFFWDHVNQFMSPFFAFGPTATFSTFVPGDYEITLHVTDSWFSTTQLTFPIHVAKKEGCSEICPPGTAESGGFCWLVGTGDFPVGLECRLSAGLSGSGGPVNGLPWTPEIMADVTAKLGCTNGGVVGCCQPTMWRDPVMNVCFTQGFAGAYVNDMDSRDGAAPIHACNPITAGTSFQAQGP